MSCIRTSRSTNSRQNQYARSKEKGIVMPSSCSRCSEKKYECRVLPGSTHYGEYGKSGVEKFCDIFGVTAAAWARVDSEERRLQKENEKFRLEARKTQSQLDKVRENAGKMLQYDLKTIEELEAFEEKERLERERAEQAERASQVASSSGVDPSIFELPPMSDSELAAWMEAVGSVDGISLSLMGSSGS
ncbi:hypothetical protein CJF32_00006702 [Rutstroemia sp. NJR-2017a WRK4]|nr:hypothetical protein CJF32_00006702 [Rutstroemia sp. NJR-2017a WRK4]